MGALTNNSRKLANFAGFYKGIQSAGGAITWRMDDTKVAYMTMFASNWGLLAGSLIIALPVILWKVEDTVAIEKDVAFTDETVAEVAPKAIVHTAHSDAEKLFYAASIQPQSIGLVALYRNNLSTSAICRTLSASNDPSSQHESPRICSRGPRAPRSISFALHTA
ncbi:MFS general substrate transporter [Alternaria alternata]|nr:MFS general substrate transporter [Alternaria alternata]